MSIEKHVENREWTFQTLDKLQAFLEDSDFEGDIEAQAGEISRVRKELQEGKYRVVFLGAFNSGKSTLINAFLGDDYLPTILEECTTKIVHIVKGDSMRVMLRLMDAATDADLEAVRSFLRACCIDGDAALSDDSPDLTISFERYSARELLTTLNALVTINAAEEFPQLAPLRAKFDELVVYLPNDFLEEDLALIDSPGVHTISETNKRIAQEVIPHCHLVICLLDSQNAGNEHNRDFIEDIVRHRHRKVFFVINKADQLNADEIDPTGRRGPAKDLLRGLEGIVSRPELFFVSSLYAVVAAQLAQNHIGLADLDQNNKIKIPLSAHQLLAASQDPARDAAEFLLTKSNFPAFRQRLFDYLYTENREGAIVQSACQFIDAHAWKCARPLEIKLDLARNVPKLAELRKQREQLNARIDQNTENARGILDTFTAMAAGGDVGLTHYDGYDGLVDARLNMTALEEEILRPVRKWLADDNNLKLAKKKDYKPLTVELEQRLDAFLQRRHAEIYQEVDAIECHVRELLGPAFSETVRFDNGHVEAPRANIVSINAGMGKSYLAFALTGLLVCGGLAAGAGIAALRKNLFELPSNVPLEAAILAATLAGALIGVLGGVFVRSLSGTETRRERLNKRIAAKVDQVLLRDVRKQLVEALEQRRGAFAASIQRVFDDANTELSDQAAAIRSEEESIERDHAEKIARLEPKVEHLLSLGRAAREITALYAPKEAGA